MGRVAGSIKNIKPAKEMSVAPPCPDAKSDWLMPSVDELVTSAAVSLETASNLQVARAKLWRPDKGFRSIMGFDRNNLNHVLCILRKAQAEQIDFLVIDTPFALIFLHHFCKFSFFVFSHAWNNGLGGDLFLNLNFRHCFDGRRIQQVWDIISIGVENEVGSQTS